MDVVLNIWKEWVVCIIGVRDNPSEISYGIRYTCYIIKFGYSAAV